MDEETYGSSSSSSSLSFPVLQGDDLNRVAQTIIELFDPSTAGNPEKAKALQHDLQGIQATTEAWGLIAGLATHPDPNVRFFSAHTAQVKISRDWNTLPPELHEALLKLLLQSLGHAVSPLNPFSYQSSNSLVVRKLFGSLASLLLRLPFHLFPSPLLTVLSTLTSSAQSAPLPASTPTSGFNTPTHQIPNPLTDESARFGWKMRLWGLEWLMIVVEEIGRAGISDQKKIALKRHLEVDIQGVMEVIMGSMKVALQRNSLGSREEAMKEAEAACKCAESWVDYGLGGDELTAMLPTLYDLLPLPAASSAIGEILSESVFKFGKGTKILTEPLVAWTISPAGSALVGTAESEPSDEVVGYVKLLAALVEHSSEWIVAHIKQPDVQSFLATLLRISGWAGTGGVDESVSELLFPIYPLLQESVMDSPNFSEPHETSENWGIAKGFFRELVAVIQRKVRWAGYAESSEGLGGMDKEDREAFEVWRRDAGEVIVVAYYILRDEMLQKFTVDLSQAMQDGQGQWQDIEAILHCVRYSSEGVPQGEAQSLPIIFGEQVLGALSQRQQQGKGENRLRLTVISVIQAYEEWFKYHPEHLLPVLSYLVPSLTLTTAVSRAAADALKALCDICRQKLVQHIGAFAQLHDKIGDLGAEEQTKVIQGITSVIQALPPSEAIGPVEGILNPIVARLSQSVEAVRNNPAAQEMLLQSLSALTASFKGLSPSDDDIFDLTKDGPTTEEKTEAVNLARADPRMINLRSRIEEAVKGVVEVWNGDGEVADALSSLVKHATLASDNLISLSPLPLLSLVTTAAERSSSALWMSLASTLVLRVNSPPSALTQKRNRTEAEEQEHQALETERWNVVGDAAARLVVVAGNSIPTKAAMVEHPDVVEGWFRFCSAMATRFPGVLLRLPTQLVEGYATIGLLGLGTQERMSLKSTCEFFVALLAGARFPSPLEPLADTLLKHFGPQILRAILLSAGSEGPRSVIPNLAELLAHFVQRIPGQEMASWLEGVLAEPGFPDQRATPAAKSRLKEVILKSRTARKMREALHEFALVSRGLDNTTYGNATAVSK